MEKYHNCQYCIVYRNNGVCTQETCVITIIEKQRRFFVDNLMLGVQLANVLTRWSSHPQGKREARCKISSDVGKQCFFTRNDQRGHLIFTQGLLPRIRLV